MVKVCKECGRTYNDVYDEDVSALGICFRCYLDSELGDKEDDDDGLI